MKKFLLAFGFIWIFIWSAFGLLLGAMKYDEWLANKNVAATSSDLHNFYKHGPGGKDRQLIIHIRYALHS
jgi:hypothetical protein